MDTSYLFIHLVYRILIRPIDGVIKMELINISDVGDENIPEGVEGAKSGW